jgi:hypothetical protein
MVDPGATVRGVGVGIKGSVVGAEIMGAIVGTGIAGTTVGAEIKGSLVVAVFEGPGVGASSFSTSKTTSSVTTFVVNPRLMLNDVVSPSAPSGVVAVISPC